MGLCQREVSVQGGLPPEGRPPFPHLLPLIYRMTHASENYLPAASLAGGKYTKSFSYTVYIGGSRISQTGVPTPEFRPNLFFGKIFGENCMKMKEIGPRGWTFNGLVSHFEIEFVKLGEFIYVLLVFMLYDYW